MKPETFGRLAAFTVLTAVVVLAISISLFGALDHYELAALDMLFRLRPKPVTTDKVVLVEIGEDTIKKLGRFPFPRSYHAILIDALSDFGAKAVLLDLFFSEEEENDPEFAAAIRKAGNVYLPFAFELDAAGRTGVPSAKSFLARSLPNLTDAAKGSGHINIVPDIDGKFRRIPPFVKYGGKHYPYVSVLMSCDYLGIDPAAIKFRPGEFVIAGDRVIPLDNRSNMIINYSAGWGRAFRHVSYVDILQAYTAQLTGQKPAIDPSIFKDKICIVGLTAAGTVDIHPSPFETMCPGVGIHAEIFNSMLNNNFLRPISKSSNLIILLLISFFTAMITIRLRPVIGLYFLLTLIISFLSIAVGLFIFKGVVIDIVYPALAMGLIYLSFTIYKYAAEMNRRMILENELEIAKKIQQSFLPREVPAVGGASVAASMFTARQVGGDLYDFCNFGEKSLGVMIGDVSGKGVPASLFMAMASGAFKFFALDGAVPGDVLANLNAKIIKESSSNLFVTVFYAVFDFEKCAVTYANGGHLPLLYLPEEGPAQFLDVDSGTPLGMLEGAYSTKQTNFRKGDIFVFYTDGITEAMNQRRDMYGAERLAAVVAKNRKNPPDTVLSEIEKDVRRFEPKKSQHDDMTLVVLKIT